MPRSILTGRPALASAFPAFYTRPTVRATVLPACALWLLAANATGEDVEARFWVLRLPPQRHPVQEQVAARPVLETENVRVFVAEGQSLPAESRLPTGGLPALAGRVEQALARLQLWQRPRLQGKVVILLWESGWPAAAPFSPFDLMGKEGALAYGFQANPSPVIVASFPFSGPQSWRNLASLLESLFLVTTLPPSDPFPTDLTRSAARWFAYRMGAAPPRYLWGDDEPHRPGPSSWSPQSAQGWGPLFAEFLAQSLGPEAVPELVAKQEAPTGPLASLLAARKPEQRAEELFASFWAKLWLAPWLGPEVAPNPLASCPRPQLLAWMVASRPASGQATVGVGGGGLVIVEGDGAPTLPLSLQGDPSARWVGSVQKATPREVSPPEALSFDATGFARVEVPALGPEERLLIFLGVLPHPSGWADERFLPLQWGLAWSPRMAPSRVRERLSELGTKRLGEAGPPLRTRVMESLKVLSGLQAPKPGVPPLASRYAWHPQAAGVVTALAGEAEKRSLRVERQSFLRSTPWGTAAEWENLVIHLPGTSPQRLPLVLVAHWDACSGDPWRSFRAARGVTDNALGVVTLLETATLLAARPHSIPVEVALLAGGCHDAAGAQAFLASRERRIAVWVELEQLWAKKAPDPSKLVLRLGETPSLFTPHLPSVFRRWGFTTELATDPTPPHTGSALASRQGAVTITICGPRGGPADGDFWPPEAELATVSPDYVLLLAQGLADLVLTLGGR